MALLVSVLWVVIGLVYIIYKGFREEPKATSSVIVTILIIISLLAIPGLIIEFISDNTDGFGIVPSILIVVSLFAAIIVAIVCIINRIDKTNAQKCSPQVVQKVRDDRKKEITESLYRSGYPHIDTDSIEELLDSPISPLNNSNTKEVPLSVCYKWMCRQATWRIEKLKNEELSQKLGVPLDIIPIDNKLPTGEAYLKRTLLAKNYLLRQKGLRYQALADGLQLKYKDKYLNESDEYYTIFNHFVDEYISEHQ